MDEQILKEFLRELECLQVENAYLKVGCLNPREKAGAKVKPTPGD